MILCLFSFLWPPQRSALPDFYRDAALLANARAPLCPLPAHAPLFFPLASSSSSSSASAASRSGKSKFKRGARTDGSDGNDGDDEGADADEDDEDEAHPSGLSAAELAQARRGSVSVSVSVSDERADHVAANSSQR